MVVGKGDENKALTDDDVQEICTSAFGEYDLAGKRIIVIVPDHTRTAPIGLFFRLLHELLGKDAKALDFLIALGTHPPMSEDKINQLFDLTAEERAEKYANTKIYNHLWDTPEELRQIGAISEDEIQDISNGLMREEVPVLLNRRIFDYDQVIIIGPTFPHEVVGFSGGNKYFFPGIAAPQIINFTHWLGAVITNPGINGTKDTPVRRVIDRAASMIPVPRLCCSLVVLFGKLVGLYIGKPEDAWAAAADLSSKVHIVYKDRTFHKVLGIAPEMYDDIWTAGKVMYKLEPVLADGAELVIYAPHIDEISYTHGEVLDQIGYHVRDYFLKRMDQFGDVPRGVLAHSTHVKGIGHYEDGVETPRCNVVLATSIPEERCKQVNLGYRDPQAIDISEYENREDEGVLLVPKAGEMLYRLSDGTVPRID